MIPKTIPDADLDALIDALLRLDDPDECRAFLEDICTIGELSALSQRYRVAQMLDAGGNYQEICRATGASTATICRVNKCLNYGGGYRAVLSKLKNNPDKENQA